MCVNPTKTAASLMREIEPTLKALLTFTGLLDTPEGAAAIKAYDAALLGIENWQNGTVAQDVLELIGDFQTVFNTLPLPPTVTVLANIILAGIETVIGVLTANSPAPVAAAEMGTHPEAKAMFQAHVAAETANKVQTLVPTFRRSIFHSPESQYKKAWDEAVASGGFPAALKV